MRTSFAKRQSNEGETLTMFSHKKVLISVLGVGMAAMVAVPVASAATHSLPAGTTVKVALKAGTKLVIHGTIDGAAITVTCTKVAASGKVPSGKPTTLPIGAPKITGCSDSLGGSDTVTTKGTWTLTENSATAMTVTIPKAGASFKSNILSSCVVTAAPAKADPIKGTYDGKSTAKYTNGAIPTKGSGCTSTTAKASMTIVLSPAPGAPPF